MTDTEHERLSTDQLAYPQGAQPTHTTDETRPVTTDTESGTPPAADPRTGIADTTQPGDTQPGDTQRGDAEQQPAQLLDSGELAGITRRWSDIQAAFVDSPQQAVQDADALVADLMQHLAQMFATERQQLEGQWSRGGTVSTEDLRVSLQRYRSFFQRLLSI